MLSTYFLYDSDVMTGELAQMVERLLSMQEVLGSIPRFSILDSPFWFLLEYIPYNVLYYCLTWKTTGHPIVAINSYCTIPSVAQSVIITYVHIYFHYSGRITKYLHNRITNLNCWNANVPSVLKNKDEKLVGCFLKMGVLGYRLLSHWKCTGSLVDQMLKSNGNG